MRTFPLAAPNATAYLRALLAAQPPPTSTTGGGGGGGGAAPRAPPPRPCLACRFYRAEPVPASWGSTALPDSAFGGRWGPPYALLQGAFGSRDPQVTRRPRLPGSAMA